MSVASSLILVIEDDIDTADAMRVVLEGAGYAVALAPNGRQALAMLETLTPTPSLILTDLMMPEMGGWDFASRLRARRQFSMIPVVLITGSAERLSEKISRTFDRSVLKPVVPSKLLDLVAEFTMRAGAARTTLKK